MSTATIGLIRDDGEVRRRVPMSYQSHSETDHQNDKNVRIAKKGVVNVL